MADTFVLTAKDLQKEYDMGKLKEQALVKVSLEIREGEIISVNGESGSGKSTLLNLLSTIDKPTAGTVEYNGRRIDNLKQKQASRLRLEEFGFVFQKYNLMPSLNIYDNIILPVAVMNQKWDKEYLAEICKRLGIEEQLRKMPGQLSGGEQQRVAIARALVNQPKVVFADEPTGNLDSRNGNEVFRILLDCARTEGKTVIFVTHNMELAEMADRKYTLQDGEMIDKI